MEDFSKFKQSLEGIKHYVYALCETTDNKRKPFYIGKGVGDRCLHHLKDNRDSQKVKLIRSLMAQNRLGIDILRHGISNDATAKLIEATCIDLLGIGELANKVGGSGSAMGRATIEEVHNLQSGEVVDIDPLHSGLAFLLNKTYKSGMSDLELLEATRGVWSKPPRDESIKFAYATYGGLIKEVYQISMWVRAGSQQYFSRSDLDILSTKRWEFVGKKASPEIRAKYVGKVINKERSYGDPFVKVGFK